MSRIGIGIITCNRPTFFEQCLKSIPKGDFKIVVVNDGTPYSEESYSHANIDQIIQHNESKGVGRSKNEAIRWLMHSKCEFIFLIEDDMKILDPSIFEAYIRGAEGSGIWHLNFGGATPMNRIQSTPNIDLNNRHTLDNTTPLQPRLVYECDNGSEIVLYRHLAGCFTFFHRNVIKEIGYHDERYHNAFEHVEHTYRIIRAGLHPPFWWFADIWDSSKYISEIPESIQNSVIAKDKYEWTKNIQFASAVFKHDYGTLPNQIVDMGEERVKEELKTLQENYGRKIYST